MAKVPVVPVADVVTMVTVLTVGVPDEVDVVAVASDCTTAEAAVVVSMVTVQIRHTVLTQY